MTVNIINGDCRDILPTIHAESFDCCVTSPPYWGLRDYGHEGQIGLEPTLQEYLQTIVSICRDIRRVLKPSATFWLNIGDSYAATTKGSGGSGKSTLGPNRDLQNIEFQKFAPRKIQLGDLKTKDLCMVPNRLAIALQEDGWWVRSEIIWVKPNPMPESIRDRPTCAHEKVWLLTKSSRYFYDADAIREEDCGKPSGNGFVRPERETYSSRGNNEQWMPGSGRNARNVWAISPSRFRGAHFATMPPDIADRCIRAGCPVGGSVLDPFGGAGTTGLVADRIGRNATLIEINSEYLNIANNRIKSDAPLFVRTAK
jgi:DNA modification methylase